MRNLANFLLFQAAWFVAVGGAARGSAWIGTVAVAVIAAVYLALSPTPLRDALYLAAAGLAGTLADSALASLGLITYPGTGEAFAPLVPPWIGALWIAFATLPRFSLAWLAPHRALAALLGAIGGPLSFWAGTRMGSIATGADPLLTYTALSVEYALATPLLLRLVPRYQGAPPRLAGRDRVGA